MKGKNALHVACRNAMIINAIYHDVYRLNISFDSMSAYYFTSSKVM
jgi:hypothetical protein